MFTEAQTQYLQEVLGVSPGSFRAVQAPAAAPEAHSSAGPEEYGTVVMTGPLTPEESALLTKILSSIHLQNFTHLQTMTDVKAQRVLVFGGNLSHGRHDFDNSTWWSAPSLQTMIGTGPVVAEHKKLTWNMLQQIAKEIQ